DAYAALGLCRRGYFVAGLGGAQAALGGAVERLRELRPREDEEPDSLVLAAADPAQPYGAALPWPKRAGGRAARVAGAHVVLLGGGAVLFAQRGARAPNPLPDPDGTVHDPAPPRPVDPLDPAGAAARRDVSTGAPGPTPRRWRFSWRPAPPRAPAALFSDRNEGLAAHGNDSGGRRRREDLGRDQAVVPEQQLANRIAFDRSSG